MKRNSFVLAILLCLLLAVNLFAADFPSTLENYYYDQAGVLSEDLEEYINYSNQDLNNKTGAEIIVACIKTTGYTDIADVAYDMFNTWKIGGKEENNGVLLLLSIDEQDYWCLQGEGLERVLSSGMIKLMVTEHLEPYFAKGDYENGVREMFDALILHLENAYSITVDPTVPEDDYQYNDDYYYGDYYEDDSSAFDTVIGFIIIAVCLSVIFGKKKNGKEHSFFSKYVAYDIMRDTMRHMSRGNHRGSGYRGGGFGGSSFGGSRGGFSGGSRGGFSGRSGGGGRSRGGGAGRR